jgi:hypothetical protein
MICVPELALQSVELLSSFPGDFDARLRQLDICWGLERQRMNIIPPCTDNTVKGIFPGQM